jgi:hypothetical protein
VLKKPRRNWHERKSRRVDDICRGVDKMLGFVAGRLGCGFLQSNKHDEQITFAIIIVRDCVGLPKRRQPNLRRYMVSKVGYAARTEIVAKSA